MGGRGGDMESTSKEDDEGRNGGGKMRDRGGEGRKGRGGRGWEGGFVQL